MEKPNGAQVDSVPPERREMALRLVLASGSPRRRELLAQAGVPFTVVTSGAEEILPAHATPEEAVCAIAAQKARAVLPLPQAQNAFVLAADTVVEIENEILGKPVSAAHATEMLHRLSGKTHRVLTGIALGTAFSAVPASEAAQKRMLSRQSMENPLNFPLHTAFAVTEVTFRTLSDAEIAAYVATGDPLDKAGAYGIQGAAHAFVSRIDGALDNVVGLPVSLVDSVLKSYFFHSLSDFSEESCDFISI